MRKGARGGGTGFSRPTRQPANPPTRQPANPPTRQPTSRPADQPTDRPANPPTRQPANPPVADRQPSGRFGFPRFGSRRGGIFRRGSLCVR
ncbi:TPA: PT domain-containing protein [Klebsiella quasipneumoniae subsp. quasipneumoniae]|nr:PT domain-containing protein [Klebsiella quasipneumoniae subsp. quasipneumoniae]